MRFPKKIFLSGTFSAFIPSILYRGDDGDLIKTKASLQKIFSKKIKEIKGR